MGDWAVNIAELAVYLSAHEHLGAFLDFPRMGEAVQTMLRNGLDSLTNKDTKLARNVLRMDDQVDAANRKMYVTLQEWMHKNPDGIERASHRYHAARTSDSHFPVCWPRGICV